LCCNIEGELMLCANICVEVPDALILDFASDPESPYEKVLKKLSDPSWPLHTLLCEFVNNLPAEAVDAALADETFTLLYGKNECLARAWIAQWLLLEKASSARLRSISEAGPDGCTMPYTAECLNGIAVDQEGMVRLAEFDDAGGTVAKKGFNFTVCPTTSAPNSTFWLLRSFYEQGVAGHVRARLDPFLWGRSDEFSRLMFKMIVYAQPVNWDGIRQLKEQHHGRMISDGPPGRSELTEFCWEPRDDGIHFACEALPAKERIGFEGARYLHAIYDPDGERIMHLDGALRIYDAESLDRRHREHLRNAGKAGLRRKIFRIDEPVHRDAFSLIAQAFFVWNADLSTYFRQTLPAHP
jgi:hypothetical protein